MSDIELKVGDSVRLALDGLVYTVAAISPQKPSIPQERFYFITYKGRWPWALAKTHTIPASVASDFMKKV